MSAEIVGVSLAVAGTVISIYNMVLFNRQSKLMEKQALWQRSEVYPYVRLEKVEFKGNSLSLALKNMSETPAFEIGLYVDYIPGSKLENGFLSFVDPVEFDNAEPYFKKAYTKRTVCPLRNKDGNNRLYGKETGVFIAELSFIFANSRKDLVSQKGHAWEINSYPLIKEKLLSQNIGYVAVTLDLVYKDAAETVQEFEPLGKFIIDLKKHENIEQAAKEKIPFKQTPIDIKAEAMDFETYKMKSFRSRLEPFP